MSAPGDAGGPASPFALPNVRAFIGFRVAFNARFYYPVFTVLFLDYGLTLSQFALLNAVWAATIVALEVPTGALADLFGRRRLVVAAALLMVAEMLLLSLAPRGRPALLFAVMLLNRLLSGAAEAAASGADEAIAYDSLKRVGLEAAWPRVLERQMRLQAAAYIAAMVVGAAVYDPALVDAVAGGLGLGGSLCRELSLRLPPLLTLGSALAAVVFARRLGEAAPEPRAALRRGTAAAAGGAMAAAARWVGRTPAALMLILIGVGFDGPLRMLVTLVSQYYRLIQIPEAAFGLIGAAMAVLGLLLPSLARRLAEEFSAWSCFAVMAGFTAAALWLLGRFIPIYGLAPVVVIYAVLMLNGFLLSHHLNRIAPAAARATVLSLKGLGFNLAYGAIGLLYSLGAAALRSAQAASPAVEEAIFRRSVGLFVWLFLPAMALLLACGRRRLP